ncbi:hypothetical protein PM082_012345 [Marasmius tenuissimus]|nr:hypothetical protein PM082_012345 [Marasmius tenuissimus]
MPTPNVITDSQYHYPRHGPSNSYSQASGVSLQSGGWNYNEFSSYNPPYPSYTGKTSHSQNMPIGSNTYGGWSSGNTSAPSHPHTTLEESYTRGYPSYHNNDPVSHRYNPDVADSYGYRPDQRLLHPNLQLPKIAPGTWSHSPSPMSAPQRSQSDPSQSSRWSVEQRSERSLDSPHWNDIILPSMEHFDQKHVPRASLEGSPLSSISSPSPSPSPLQIPSSHLPAAGSKNQHPDGKPAIKMCSHCRATSTPLWRREPGTLKPLCNACGLYLQQRNKLRPQELIDADIDDNDSDVSGDGNGPECSHCHTHNTSVWRRSKTGEQLCNACGVYSRLRGRDRPLSLKRNKIKPRTKHAPTK